MAFRKSIGSHRAAALLVGLLALGPGCSVSPMPEPPNLGPSNMTAGPCGPRCDGDVIVVIGAAGAAEPPGALVRLTNIDLVTPAEEYSIAEDGSFSAMIEGGNGNEIRIQVVAGEMRSKPVDFIAPAIEGVPTLVEHALGECFATRLATDVGFGHVASGATSTRTIELRNECDDAITVGRIAMRVPTSAFVVMGPSLPLVLSADESATIDLRFVPDRNERFEELLLIEVSAPVSDRRAVSLFGSGEGF